MKCGRIGGLQYLLDEEPSVSGRTGGVEDWLRGLIYSSSDEQNNVAFEGFQGSTGSEDRDGGK